MKIQKGDIVRYSAKWLRSVGIYTGRLPFITGEVLEVSTELSFPLVSVQWDDEVIMEVNGNNLEVLKRKEGE